MTARRIAGNVGCGGPVAILFSPARFGETAALQVGVGDHRHQGVTMKATPGAAFEVIEAQFFLELLMRLLANRARLDRRGERLEIGLCGQVGEIVFLFARAAAFAYEPGFLARHVLHALVADALWRPIGNAHADGGEGGMEGSESSKSSMNHILSADGQRINLKRLPWLRGQGNRISKQGQ